ncbi:hypothetical protein B4U79_12546, partial [Dinothrombium tinctorium]
MNEFKYCVLLSKKRIHISPFFNCFRNKCTASVLQTNDEKQTHSKIGEKRLIYSGQLAKNLKAVKYFSLSTSFIGVCLQPLFLNKALNSGAVVCGVVAFTSFSFICSPLLLNLISKRYVTELYFDENEKTFTACTLSFFNRKVSVDFKASDVNIPTVPGLFTTFLVFNKLPLFVDQELVTDLEAYKHLLGFDKPLE